MTYSGYHTLLLIERHEAAAAVLWLDYVFVEAESWLDSPVTALALEVSDESLAFLQHAEQHVGGALYVDYTDGVLSVSDGAGAIASAHVSVSIRSSQPDVRHMRARAVGLYRELQSHVAAAAPFRDAHTRVLKTIGRLSDLIHRSEVKAAFHQANPEKSAREFGRREALIEVASILEHAVDLMPNKAPEPTPVPVTPHASSGGLK